MGTLRAFIHNFAAIAAQVTAGENLVAPRHGKPMVKIVRPVAAKAATEGREALIQKALAFRMSQTFGHAGKFVRDDAYDD